MNFSEDLQTLHSNLGFGHIIGFIGEKEKTALYCR